MVTVDVIKLQLENIVAGGDALGRFNGKPIFVEGGAPNETVLCRIVNDKKTWARAELLEITEPSPVRTESVCKFYGKCGGCNLAHIDYEAQLEIKTSIFKEAFLRIGGISPPDIEVFASSPFEYRNRMQFHCFRQLAKNLDSPKFGLKGRKSTDIIAVTDCPVAVPGLREFIGKKGKGVAFPPEKDRFNVFSKDTIFLSEGGQQRGRIKILDKEITIDVSLFFQSNCFMLEKMILKLREVAKRADRSLSMADLYCGVGTFAFYLADIFPKIFLAEENKNAVSLARENLKGINTEYFALRDTEWPETILRQKDIFGFAVLDPPRAGLSPKLAQSISQNGPPVLTYVSCDPASLIRDSKILRNGGYKLIELYLFDFYPQTAHIESLAVFER